MGLSLDELLKLLKEAETGLPLKQVKVDGQDYTVETGALKAAQPIAGQLAAVATATYHNGATSVAVTAHWVHLGQGTLQVGTQEYDDANVALGEVTHGPRLWAKVSASYTEGGQRHVLWLYYDIVDLPLPLL